MRQPQTDHVNSTDEIRIGLPTLNPSWEMRNCLHLDLRKTVLVIVRSVVYYANVSANTNKQVFLLPKEAFYRCGLSHTLHLTKDQKAVGGP